MKRIAIIRGVFPPPQRRWHDVRAIRRRQYYFSSMKDINGLKSAILNYADSVEELPQRRKEHEAKVKAIFEEHLGGYPREDEMVNLCMESCEKDILNGDVSNIERVSPKVLLYYVLEAVTQLGTHLEQHKGNIIKHDAVTKRENYFRINSYYYDKERVDVPFMSLYKSLSNLLYSVSENRIECAEAYEHVKDQIVQNYMNIEDVVRKAPAFLNISVFFFLINCHIYLGKSIKMRNLCIDVLNPYVSAISDDEMNISSDDTFYLILALRLYFSSFSYNSDVLNQLSIYNKQFVSSILSLPNYSDGVHTDQNEKYVYITEFLNRQDKSVELKKVYIPPFSYSLTSLKNQTVYILDSPQQYYANEAATLRSCVFWRYYLASKDGFTLLRLCQKEDYADLFTESKRDEVLQASISKHYLYDCDQLVRPPGKKLTEGKG